MGAGGLFEHSQGSSSLPDLGFFSIHAYFQSNRQDWFAHPHRYARPSVCVCRFFESSAFSSYALLETEMVDFYQAWDWNAFLSFFRQSELSANFLFRKRMKRQPSSLSTVRVFVQP